MKKKRKMKTYKEFTDQLYNITEEDDGIFDELMMLIKKEQDSTLKKLLEQLHEAAMRMKYSEKEIDREKAEKEMEKIAYAIRDRQQEMVKARNVNQKNIIKMKLGVKIQPILKKIENSSSRWRRMSRNLNRKNLKNVKPISNDNFRVIRK